MKKNRNIMLLKGYPFTPQESAIRKQWLFATAVSFASSVLYPLLFLTWLIFFKEGSIPKDSIYELSKQAVIGILQLWMIWHCSYRKPGTALLTWWLIIGALNPLGSLYILKNAAFNAQVIITELKDLALYVWWWILSFKLRKLNKKIQRDTFIPSEVRVASINSIRSAVNLDDLTFRYHEALREQPAHFSQILSPHYVEMKKQLSETNR